MDVCGTLAVVSGDNIGSCALGGFKESCSAYRMCRHCMATQDNFRSLVSLYRLIKMVLLHVHVHIL